MNWVKQTLISETKKNIGKGINYGEFQNLLAIWQKIATMLDMIIMTYGQKVEAMDVTLLLTSIMSFQG